MKVSKLKRDQGKYCCAYACKNEPIKRKMGLCHKHYYRYLREKDPIQIRYSQAKQKAKVRKIKFTITLDWFRWFCKKTGYLSKGKRGQNATLDRMCNIHGYHPWNIQILTNKQNAKKGNSFSGDEFDCPF